MIRFRLDDYLVEELPHGWDDLSTAIKTDRSLVATRLVTVDTRLRWWRDGYRYLRDLWRANPECGEALLRIEEDPHEDGSWQVIYRGVVKLPAATWGYEPDYVEAPVEDDSFYAYLKNNKDIEVDVTLPQTKNGQPLTPLLPRSWAFQDPLGVQPDVARDAYLLHDVLQYLWAFLTDGRVALVAPPFAPGGPLEGFVLQTGYRLRTGLTLYEPLTLKLQDVLTELDKNFHLGLQLRFTGGVPELRLDFLDALNAGAPVLSLAEAHPVTVAVDSGRLYGTVRVGSKTTLDQSGSLPFPESIRWRGFVEEQYYLLGQCNLANELDLVREWIVSSNVLEQIVWNLDDGYDDQVCLVQVDVTTGSTANTNWLLASPGAVTYYNEALTNEQVVRRWLGGVPASLASELGNVPSGRFRAEKTAAGVQSGTLTSIPSPTTVSLSPATFQDDFTAPNFDQGGVYAPGTSRWTAPIAGVYSFEFQLQQAWIFAPDPLAGLFGRWRGEGRGYLRRYDSGGSLLQTIYSPYLNLDTQGTINPYSAGTNPVTFTFVHTTQASFACNAGDYVTVGWEGWVETVVAGALGSLGYYLRAGSYFACIQTSDFGDFTQQVDAARNLNYLLRFKAPLTRPELRALLANPSGAVDLTVQGRRFRGWLEAAKYDHSSNLADFTLATAQNLLPL